MNQAHPLGLSFVPCLEDCRPTLADKPVSRSRRSVPKRCGGNVARVCQERCCLLFGITSVSFELKRWFLSWENPHRRLLLGLGVVLVHPSSVSCYDVPNDRPLSHCLGI